MVRISGWVYLVVGAAVTFFSWYVQNRGGKGLALFFWAGIALIGIGVFKVVSAFILREKKEKKKKEEGDRKLFGFKTSADDNLSDRERERIIREKKAAVDAISRRNTGRPAPGGAPQGITACPNCGTKHYSNSNFCHMCGARLK